MMGAARRALRITAGSLLALLLLAALGFGLLQTPWGKAWLSVTLAHALSSPGERVVISGLSGFIPTNMQIARIEIADAAGPRLVISDAEIAIAAGDLLAGRLTLRQLTARAIDLARPSGSSGGFDPKTMLHPPLAVAIERLEVDRLTLGPAFLGEPVAATLTARFALGGGRASADLDLHRIDGKTAQIALHLAFAGSPPTLSLNGEIEEPSGRLVADLLHRDQPLPLALHLEGSGPLADWHGTLAANAGSEARLGADFRITGDGGYRIAATGNAEIARLLPSELQPLAGDAQRFDVQVEVGDARIAVERLAASVAAGTLSAQGNLDRRSDALAGEAALTVPDLAPLSPLLGSASRGALMVSLALGGALHDPVARIAVTGDGVAFADSAIAHAAATVDLHAGGDPLAAATPIDIAASGDAAGLSLGQAALPTALRDRLGWRLAARLDRARDYLEVHELAIAAGGNTARVTGAGALPQFAGTAHLDIPKLAAIAGAAAKGALVLDGDFRRDGDGSAVVVLSGTARAANTGTDALDRLLGAQAVLNGTLRRSADGALNVSDLRIDGAEARLEGGAERAPDGVLAADVSLSLPHLAVLAAGVSGSASLAAKISGPPQRLSVDARLTAETLAAGAARLDRLQAHLALADLAHPDGRLEADFHGEGLDGTALIEGTLAAPETLRLSRVEIEAARTRLAGSLTLRLADYRADGTLTGTAPDLAPWSRLLGTPLAGSVQAKANLSAAKGQNLELTLDGKQLSIGTGSFAAQRLHAAAQLSDVLAAPAGRADLQIDGARAGNVTLSALALKATSDRPGRFAIETTARGNAGQSFSLTSAAALTVAGQDMRLTLTRLTGALGTVPLALRRPLQLDRRGGDIDLADLDLGLGDGHVGGSAKLSGERLALHLLATNLPLHELTALGGVEQATGVLGFELHVTGTRAAPEGELVLDGEELRFAAASRPDLPPLGLVTQASWRGGELRFKGRLAGPNDAAVGFTGAAPLRLDPQRLAVHLPPQGAVALHLEGDGELANLADMLPVGEDRLAGHFTIDASVQGTVAAPEASGRLSVRDGRYESLVAGTTLTGVGFDLVGNRERLVLQNFTASDGAKGTLALAGAVNLGAAGGPAFEVTGKLTSFRALQRDEATATASGEVQLAGNIAAPRLVARLRIERAELRVPEKLPQSARPIPVTMIDSATGQVLAAPQQNAQTASWLALGLDVVVDIPGQVFVRGRGIDSEWRGRLTATGTSAAPVLDGKLEVVRGTYDFIGKTATLSRGTISFLGGRRIDPDIDIEARVTSNDIVAIVRITGTATQPKIQISSQPELPQDEILSRLLFGTSVSKISTAQGLELAQAAAALASGGDPGILDKIRTGLGLDRLSLGSSNTNAFNNIGVPSLSTPQGVPSAFPTGGVGSSATPLGSANGNAGAAAVSAGKYVADGVYVGVTQGLGASSSSVDVQIDVTRHISVDTTAGQTAGTGVGVNWKLDY